MTPASGLHSYKACGGRCASHNRGVEDPFAGVAEFGQVVRRSIADGDSGTLRLAVAELLGVELDDVRARVNTGDLMLQIEVKR